MSDLLTCEVADRVAVLTLNRPDAMNALSRDLRRDLVRALREMDAREDVGAVVLTATGRAFSAGLDVKEFGTPDPEPGADRDIGRAFAGLSVPVVAAVQGLAVTGGFELALCCDMIVAGRSAQFQDTHVKIGALPGMGMSQRLTRLVGLPRAKEIVLSARRLPAEEGAALGFVLKVVEDAELPAEARALAGAMAGWPKENVSRLKRLMDEGAALPLGEALALEGRAVAR
ncbi:enoyl-CoA hydratase [Aquicoccus sp. SCR17]|nr:enoyl-CoA hydratase [Carideicomes alvinocaridis]